MATNPTPINPGANPPTGGPTPRPQPQQHRNRTKKPAPVLLKVIPSWLTILIGIGVCILLAIGLIGLLAKLIGTGWFAWLLCSVIVFGGVGVYGIVPVEIQHTAIPLFFGRRISWFVLEEGWNWLLPSPIMDIAIVNMRERVLRIGEKFGQEKIEELVAATIQTPEKTAADPDPHGDVRLVEMISRITIMWIVTDPKRFINVGEATIEGALTDLAVKTFRAEASMISDIDLIRSTDDFENHVRKALINDKDVTTKQRMTDIYGIRIRRVIIPKVTHKDSGTVKSYERVAQEKREKQAQEIERTFLLQSIEILKTTGMTAEQALLAIQAQRGKNRRQELIIRAGEGVSEMAKAAAVIQQGGGLFAPLAPIGRQDEGVDAGDRP